MPLTVGAAKASTHNGEQGFYSVIVKEVCLQARVKRSDFTLCVVFHRGVLCNSEWIRFVELKKGFSYMQKPQGWTPAPWLAHVDNERCKDALTSTCSEGARMWTGVRAILLGV